MIEEDDVNAGNIIVINDCGDIVKFHIIDTGLRYEDSNTSEVDCIIYQREDDTMSKKMCEPIRYFLDTMNDCFGTDGNFMLVEIIKPGMPSAVQQDDPTKSFEEWFGGALWK